MFHPDILATFQQILSIPGLPVQQMSYDTTFTLGDFYLSILVFRETEFTSPPVIPLAYMIHERKLSSTHDTFWYLLKRKCPELCRPDCNVVIITDQEESITQSIQKHFPDIPHFLCTNHIMQDCKHWLRSHGATTALETTYYIDCIQTMLLCETEIEYKDMVIANLQTWSQPFTQYFMSHINAKSHKVCTWATKKHGVNNLTTNQSESFNSSLRGCRTGKKLLLML